MEQKPVVQNHFVEHCGIVIDKAEGGRCEGHCLIEEKHLNPVGTAHGGLSFTMMDTVAGTAVKSLDRARPIVTVSSSVSFLRPVMPGMAICTAEIVKNGRKLAFVDAEIRSEDGKLLVKGSFEFCYTD